LLVTTAVGVAVEQRRATLSPEDCQVSGYVVYASDENVSDLEDDAVVRFEDLTERQRAIVERAVATEGEEVPLEGEDRAAVASIEASAVVYDGDVYRDRTALRCPLVAGVSPSFNPLIRPFATLYFLLSGPLLPLVILGVAGGVAYAVGEWATY